VLDHHDTPVTIACVTVAEAHEVGWAERATCGAVVAGKPRSRQRTAPSGGGRLDSGGDVAGQFLGAPQGAADPFDLRLAGGDLAGRLADLVCPAQPRSTD